MPETFIEIVITVYLLKNLIMFFRRKGNQQFGVNSPKWLFS